MLFRKLAKIIRNNEKINKEEINNLQDILFNELNSNKGEYKMNYNNESLVLLVRKTVGLSKEAIDREISKYIRKFLD